MGGDLVKAQQRRTYTVPEAAALLGISKAKAYESVRTGEIEALQFGRRIVIPAIVIDQLLGLDAEQRSPGTRWRQRGETLDALYSED